MVMALFFASFSETRLNEKADVDNAWLKVNVMLPLFDWLMTPFAISFFRQKNVPVISASSSPSSVILISTGLSMVASSDSLTVYSLP